MLSVCIPVYNYTVYKLVYSLILQSEKLADNQIEILLIDDASQSFFIEQNRKIEAENLRWIYLKQNVGRAVIRNMFLQYAKGEYLLFLDCDSEIVNDNFLSNYLQYVQNNNAGIVCGGRVYPGICLDPNQKLRWKYGLLKESKNARFRSKYPNKSFMTNNFLIKRELLEEIPFNEDLKMYGHEDTWFGYQLQKHGIEIYHIENPVLNGEIESNEIYLQKTEQAISSLILLIKTQGEIPEFEQNIQLLKTYRRLERYYLLWLFNLKFGLLKDLIRYFTLLSKSLFFLNVYKLGLFSERLKQ